MAFLTFASAKVVAPPTLPRKYWVRDKPWPWVMMQSCPLAFLTCAEAKFVAPPILCRGIKILIPRRRNETCTKLKPSPPPYGRGLKTDFLRLKKKQYIRNKYIKMKNPGSAVINSLITNSSACPLLLITGGKPADSDTANLISSWQIKVIIVSPASVKQR